MESGSWPSVCGRSRSCEAETRVFWQGPAKGGNLRVSEAGSIIATCSNWNEQTVFLSFFKFLILKTSLIPCRKFGSLYLGKATAASRAALIIPASLCSTVSKQWNCCQRLGFLMCALGCMNTIQTFVLKVDSGRKKTCCAWESNPGQHCTWLFSLTLYQQNHILPQP